MSTLPRLGITLLRKVPELKREPRMWEGEVRALDILGRDGRAVRVPIDWRPGMKVRIEEVLPE